MTNNLTNSGVSVEYAHDRLHKPVQELRAKCENSLTYKSSDADYQDAYKRLVTLEDALGHNLGLEHQGISHKI